MAGAPCDSAVSVTFVVVNTCETEVVLAEKSPESETKEACKDIAISMVEDCMGVNVLRSTRGPTAANSMATERCSGWHEVTVMAVGS